VKLLPPLLTLIIAGVLLTACGISFSEGSPESELFTDLTVLRHPTVLEPVTAVLEYEQAYPVAVKVKCYLVRPDRARWLVFRDTIPANPDDSLDAEAVPGEFSFRFLVSKPGKHFLDCLTPKDASNVIQTEFKVAEGANAGAD
jgi:hypothetical protein